MTGWLCALPILSALWSACALSPPLASGYVEGQYVLIAPVATARLHELEVVRGDRVEVGQLLARMEVLDAQITLSQAEAALAQAGAALANLLEGKRPEEIRAIEAALASVQAQANEADLNAARQQRLAERGNVSAAQRDDAVTAAAVAQAGVAEMEANLAVARLPARAQEIAAAEAELAGAQAARELAAWNLEQRDLRAASAGAIFDVIRTPGEIAGPAAPVLSMLPDGAVKLRLYFPQNQVAAIATGDQLDVRCDGCPEGLTATISYIADAPEFTPPVIYSIESRQKLVYLVEARPDADASLLKPGQIVDVVLPDAGT